MFALKAQYNLPFEHFDIKAAYLHEPYHQDHPMHFWQPKRADGTLKLEGLVGLLLRNRYRTPPAAKVYLDGLVAHLTTHGYTQSQADPNLLTNVTAKGTICITVTLDDFLAIATNTSLTNDLHQTLKRKSAVMPLGPPTQYHIWKRSHCTDGAIQLPQPQVMAQILEKQRMTDFYPKSTLFRENSNDVLAIQASPLQAAESQTFRQTDGNLR